MKIETGNNETGVYTINLLFHSVDRTVRDREALERIELDNAVLDARSKKLQGYFDINKVIGKAELYPDLELPTIENMKKAGYDFLRYKFQDDRVYVDPDFYFIYPYNLNSSLTREMCISGIKNGWA